MSDVRGDGVDDLVRHDAAERAGHLLFLFERETAGALVLEAEGPQHVRDIDPGRVRPRAALGASHDVLGQARAVGGPRHQHDLQLVSGRHGGGVAEGPHRGHSRGGQDHRGFLGRAREGVRRRAEDVDPDETQTRRGHPRLFPRSGAALS